MGLRRKRPEDREATYTLHFISGAIGLMRKQVAERPEGSQHGNIFTPMVITRDLEQFTSIQCQ